MHQLSAGGGGGQKGRRYGPFHIKLKNTGYTDVDKFFVWNSTEMAE